jgi:hypothetical protein
MHMTAKKAVKKQAAKKRSPADASPVTWTFTIKDDGSFNEDPLNAVRDGDTILVAVAHPGSCFDIKIKITKKPCGGMGGGPIIIHS